MKKWIVVVFLSLTCRFFIYAQDGFLDPGFGGQGTGYVSLDTVHGFPYFKTIITAEDKILLLGFANLPNQQVAFQITRRLPDGAPDPSFGDDGLARLTQVPFETQGVYKLQMVEQTDGKILIGSLGFEGDDAFYIIMRLNPDGTIDSTFAEDGYRLLFFIEDAYAVLSFTCDPEDHIFLVGVSGNQQAIWKWDPDGNPDLTFGTNGRFVLPHYQEMDWLERGGDIKVLPDGKLLTTAFVVDGDHGFIVSRVLPSAQVDPSFGENGSAFIPLINNTGFFFAIHLTPDGGYLLHDYHNYSTGLNVYKLLGDGQPDLAFGQQGVAVTPAVLGPFTQDGLVICPDGRILVTSAQQAPDQVCYVMRYFPDFALDTTFGENGVFSLPIEVSTLRPSSLVIQQDKVVLNTLGGDSPLYYSTLFRIVLEKGVAVAASDDPRYAIASYPNPSRDAVNIQLPDGIDKVQSACLINCEGRIIHLYPGVRVDFSGVRLVQLQLPQGLAAGLYYISLKTREGDHYIRVMVE